MTEWFPQNSSADLSDWKAYSSANPLLRKTLMVYSDCKLPFISSSSEPKNQRIEGVFTVPKAKRVRIYFEIVFLGGFEKEITISIDDIAYESLRIDTLTQMTLDFCGKGKTDYVLRFSKELPLDKDKIKISLQDSSTEPPSTGFWGMTNLLLDFFEECQSNADTLDDKTCKCNDGFYPVTNTNCPRKKGFSGTLCNICKPCPRNMVTCQSAERAIQCSKGLDMIGTRCLAQKGYSF